MSYQPQSKGSNVLIATKAFYDVSGDDNILIGKGNSNALSTDNNIFITNDIARNTQTTAEDTIIIGSDVSNSTNTTNCIMIGSFDSSASNNATHNEIIMGNSKNLRIRANQDEILDLGSGTYRFSHMHGKVVRKTVNVSTSSHAVSKLESLINVDYSSTGICSISIDNDHEPGSVVCIFDSGASASGATITITPSSHVFTDGAGSKTITTNRGHLRMQLVGSGGTRRWAVL
jgi:hypothetical protein